MSDDSDDTPLRARLNSQTLLVAVIALALVSGGAFAVTNTFTATKDARIVADTGATVVFGQTSINIESGNPVIKPNTISLNGTRFRSDGAPSARIDTLNSGGWTNVSQVSASNSLFIINRTGTYPVGTTGTIDSASVTTLDLSDTTSNTDIVASAGGSWTLTINNTGLAQGQGVVVIDRDTGKALDAASVDADGDVTFNELSSVTNAKLDIQKGPAELKVYKESKPTDLVTNAQLRIRIFGQDSDTVIERTVTNGKLDLTGIPKDEPLTITVSEDTSGYAYRRTIIQSVTQQQEIYLLNTTTNTNIANVIFELDDRTGNFPASSTQLIIQKPITKDFDGDGTSETRYQAIAGDTFGGTGEFGTTLEAGERYRLKIKNGADTRILGSYTATVDDRATLQVGQVSIQSSGQQGYSVDLRTITSDSDGDGYAEQFVRVIYNDGDEKTESLSYTIRNRTAGTIVTEQTLTGPFGSHVATYNVGENASDSTYRLTWNATREQPDGSDKKISGTKYAGNVPGIGDQLPIDSRWLTLIGYVSIVALAGLVVIVEPALGGIVATGWAAALTILGILAIPAPALGLAGAISFAALIGRQQS